MKRLLLAASIAVLMLSGTAMASPRHGGHGDHDRGYPAWNGDRDGDRDHDRREGRWHHDNGRHLGQYKFARGQRVPVVYLQPRYYVEDYRVYHLAPPPRGYRWVRPENGHFLLVAATTGLISEILGY
jgi:Ni/Co efflux regulator RcnB